MSNSGLTRYQDECLEILAEECAEIIQEKAKIFRFGAANISHHYSDGRTHLACLEQELGDLLAMIHMVRDSGIGITDYGIEKARQKKLEKVIKWMNNTPDNETASPAVYQIDPLPTLADTF